MDETVEDIELEETDGEEEEEIKRDPLVYVEAKNKLKGIKYLFKKEILELLMEGLLSMAISDEIIGADEGDEWFDEVCPKD